MYTRIGPAGTGNFDGLIQNPGQRPFNLSLYGVIFAAQALPATVAGTVIADIKPQIPHNRAVPLLLPAHCPQKTEMFRFCHRPEHDRVHT
jgi:hypothetical protein